MGLAEVDKGFMRSGWAARLRESVVSRVSMPGTRSAATLMFAISAFFLARASRLAWSMAKFSFAVSTSG